jgi:superoxide reductase
MSVERQEIYKCRVCGIVAEIVDAGAGEPVCCGLVMTLLEPGSLGDPAEHGLHWRRQGDGIVVSVAGGEHPMEPRHFIQWVEVLDGPRAFRLFLAPGEPAEAFLPRCDGAQSVRVLCNRHGLWQSRVES